LIDETRLLIRDMLNADPSMASAFHLLGRLAARERRGELALACFRRAIENQRDDTPVDWLADLTDALECREHDEEIVSLRLRALQRRPEDPLVYRTLGKTLLRSGKHDAAVAAYREALRLQPDAQSILGEIGGALDAAGLEAAALSQYYTSLRQRPDDAEMYGRIGRLHLRQKSFSLAQETFSIGLDCDSLRDVDRVELSFGIAQVQIALRQYEEAASTLRTVLSIDAAHLGALSRLVFVLELLGKPADTAQAWLALGIALEDRARVLEATDAYRQVLVRQPDCLEARLRLGSVLMLVGEAANAVPHLKAAVEIAPEHAAAHVKLGCARHLTGQAKKGWEEFGWLYPTERLKVWHAFEQPIWDGTTLERRTVLLWAPPDLGLGDTLQFVRYVRHLKVRGAEHVIVECQRSLVSLAASVPGVDRAVARQSSLPPFDVHVPMMLVPVLDCAARRPLPTDVPYLSIDQRYVEYWHEQLGTFSGLTVGLCWSAHSPRRDRGLRSVPLAALLPLASVGDVRFVSLQLGPGEEEALAPPPRLHVKRLLSSSPSTTHTAALIQTLDLVITVDTMIAHLAGALGQAVWTLLPSGACWRWGQSEETTPWYPTMRLFRQRRLADWDDVLERVSCELDRVCASRSRRGLNELLEGET
jgi:tetratricopeptide (TPR) repeat protein